MASCLFLLLVRGLAEPASRAGLPSLSWQEPDRGEGAVLSCPSDSAFAGNL